MRAELAWAEFVRGQDVQLPLSVAHQWRTLEGTENIFRQYRPPDKNV